MAANTIVTWQNSYSVGIKLIDDQHKVLIRLTNRLFVNCMAGRERTRDAFLDTVREAIDYVGYHFGTEEKVMDRINYPDYAKHKMEHADFVREVYDKVDEYKAGKLMAPLSFVYFLRDWVLLHIAVSDKKLGGYLKLMHKNGELQKITLKVKEDKATKRVEIQ